MIHGCYQQYSYTGSAQVDRAWTFILPGGDNRFAVIIYASLSLRSKKLVG